MEFSPTGMGSHHPGGVNHQSQLYSTDLVARKIDLLLRGKYSWPCDRLSPMSTPPYTKLTQLELNLIGLLEGFKAPQWNGPALPRPDGQAGLEQIFDTLNKLLARAQYLIQAKDGLSIEYTLNGITATAERFMLGTHEQVEQAAQLEVLITQIEAFLRSIFNLPAHASRIDEVFAPIRLKMQAASTAVATARTKAVGQASGVAHLIGDAWTGLIHLASEEQQRLAHLFGHGGQGPALAAAAADYTKLSLESPEQFSMAWTTLQDGFRHGYPRIPEYVKAVTDPAEATRAFWPMIRSTALPYNLFVMRRLTAATVANYQINFGNAWLPQYNNLLSAGKLYGIDMTVFEGLDPQLDNGTARFTPSTMVLLEMDGAKNVNPIAVYVADPQDVNTAKIYTQASPAWVYALMAAKTSLTVYGIWLGHVYTLHIVTAAMQMSTINVLPKTNIVYQLIAPQSNYTIPFDLVLMLGWPNLSPPTSISDSGKFLSLCNKFSATHDFFSTDPDSMLANMNLDPADFTDPAIDGGKQWNLYPNVQVVKKVWAMVASYVGAVVDAGYASDAAVAADTDLANWIQYASTTGNVAGLPAMKSKQALKDVVTSVLYRITFHGMGRLRSVGTPEPPFATNYPPCLQKTNIPDPTAPLLTNELLKYLPNTGTLGKLVSFYYIFAYNAPYVPVVPEKGPDAELFFDNAKFPAANQALIGFRKEIESFIKWLQPDWVQTGQWPRNIEL